MTSDHIPLRERRKIRRAGRREAYDCVRNCQTLEEALRLGRRRMHANYSGVGLTIALIVVELIIKWLWERRSEDGVLPALPTNWETRFDRAA